MSARPRHPQKERKKARQTEKDKEWKKPFPPLKNGKLDDDRLTTFMLCEALSPLSPPVSCPIGHRPISNKEEEEGAGTGVGKWKSPSSPYCVARGRGESSRIQGDIHRFARKQW